MKQDLTKQQQFNLELGQRVRNERKAQHLTIAKLAEKAGLSSVYISKIEHGKCTITTETLIKLCNALEISADYLVNNTQAHTNVILERLQKRLHSYPEEQQKIYREIIHSIIMYHVDTAAKEREAANNQKQTKR